MVWIWWHHKIAVYLRAYIQYVHTLDINPFWLENNSVNYCEHTISVTIEEQRTYMCNNVFVSKQCMSAPAPSNTCCMRRMMAMSVHPSGAAALISIRPKALWLLLALFIRDWEDGQIGAISQQANAASMCEKMIHRERQQACWDQQGHVRINCGFVTVWGWCQQW